MITSPHFFTRQYSDNNTIHLNNVESKNGERKNV